MACRRNLPSQKTKHCSPHQIPPDFPFQYQTNYPHIICQQGVRKKPSETIKKHLKSEMLLDDEQES